MNTKLSAVSLAHFILNKADTPIFINFFCSHRNLFIIGSVTFGTGLQRWVHSTHILDQTLHILDQMLYKISFKIHSKHITIANHF